MGYNLVVLITKMKSMPIFLAITCSCMCNYIKLHSFIHRRYVDIVDLTYDSDNSFGDDNLSSLPAVPTRILTSHEKLAHTNFSCYVFTFTIRSPLLIELWSTTVLFVYAWVKTKDMAVFSSSYKDHGHHT